MRGTGNVFRGPGLPVLPAATEVSVASGGVIHKKQKLAITSTGKSVTSGGVGMKKQKLAITGSGKAVISGGPAMKKQKISGTLVKKSVASGGVILKKQKIAGSLIGKTVATGGVKLKKMVLAIAGGGKAIFSGGVKLKKQKIAGSLTAKSVATGGIAHKKQKLALSGSGKAVISGGPRHKKMVIAGSLTTKKSASVAVRMKKMTLVLSGAGKTSAAVSVKHKKMKIAGTLTGKSVVSGGARQKKMVLAITGGGKAVLSGGPRMKKMGLAISVSPPFERSNTFEGGTNGATITTGNSGGTSGNAFDGAVVQTSHTMVYDSTRAAHGSRSMAITMGATLGQAYTHWQVPGAGSVPKLYGRFYIYQTAIVAASTRIATLYNVAPATTACMFIRLVTGTGKIELVGAGGTIWTSANALPLNQWVRVEFMCVGHATAGQASMSYYSGDSTTATESSGVFTNQNTTGEIASVAWGISSNNASLAKFWLDDVGSSQIAALGPYVAPSGNCSIAISMKKMVIAGSGKGKTVATGGPVMKKTVLALTGIGKTVATGGVKLKKMVLAIFGGGKTFASVAVRMKKQKIAASGAGKAVVTGGPVMKKMRIAASGAGKTSASVTIRMKKQKIAASGGPAIELAVATIDLHHKKMRIAGTGAGKSVATGGVTQKKMRILAIGPGITVGVIRMKQFKMVIHIAGSVGEEIPEPEQASQLFIFSPL